MAFGVQPKLNVDFGKEEDDSINHLTILQLKNLTHGSWYGQYDVYYM